jgi:predicted rRNA methylase YqxC with S4 and FtsJ domains
LVHLSDSQFEGKAKVIAITGIVPNCKDEARFLAEYQEQHSHQDIAVIGLAFEAYKDTLKSDL